MPRIVYCVMHHHALVGGDKDTKVIGFFVALADAEAALGRAKLRPGFREAPDSFEVRTIELDRDLWEIAS